MIRFISLTLSLLVSTPAFASDRTVILVLFDGLAPAMIEATDTPNLDRIRAEGSWSHDMRPVFPTISATNHVSYTTGCEPAGHGIVSNYFHDPVKGYYDGGKDADWRTGCEAIWETAERAGLPAAALGFVGHYSGTKGPAATHAPIELTWNEAPEDPGRTDQVIELLNSSAEDRPKVIAAYYKGPDNTAHWQGTTAEETLAAVRAADAEIGRILEAIDTLPEGREASLMIAADHGMVDVKTYFNIGRVMNRQDIDGKYSSDGAHAYIYLDDKSDLDRAAAALETYDMLSVHKAGEFPGYARLGEDGRAGDILIVLDQPYWIADPSEFPWWARWVGLTLFWPDTVDLSAGIKATHGYPPTDDNMGTTFYAWGAGIKPGLELPAMNMIDATPTALQLLGVDPHESASGIVRDEMLE
jgi:predicted AlkP superfamily pyrophosphatase or phosphodiesterase